jgi:hypothetical protein
VYLNINVFKQPNAVAGIPGEIRVNVYGTDDALAADQFFNLAGRTNPTHPYPPDGDCHFVTDNKRIKFDAGLSKAAITAQIVNELNTWPAVQAEHVAGVIQFRHNATRAVRWLRFTQVA